MSENVTTLGARVSGQVLKDGELDLSICERQRTIDLNGNRLDDDMAISVGNWKRGALSACYGIHNLNGLARLLSQVSVADPNEH